MAAIVPTFSWPWIIGNSNLRSPYCVTYPWKVCLSVPQIPDISIFTRTHPGAGSGNGYSRNSYFPGSTSVAASTPWADIAESLSLYWAGDLVPATRFKKCGEPFPQRFPAGVRGVARVTALKIQFQRKLADARVVRLRDGAKRTCD